MKQDLPHSPSPCLPLSMSPSLRSRRSCLADLGMGFTGMALGAMLQRDRAANAASANGWTPPDGVAHFAPKAKSVIWLFMIGGASQVESFDPKPALNKYAGKTIAETPYKAINDSPYIKENLRVVTGSAAKGDKLLPLQIGYRKRGESGIEVSNWFPHVGGMIDDISVVRSMWTTDDNHGAQLQMHTGRHSLDGFFPTIGAWVHYGLGTLNENLPQFVVLGRPIADCCGGLEGHRANYLGPIHDGVPLAIDPNNPLPFASPQREVFLEEQQAEFQLLNRLNRLSAAEYPEDAAMRARIKSYELAFRMQKAVPDVVRFTDETKPSLGLYESAAGSMNEFGKNCLAARRLVERGVRFVQIFHGGTGSAGAWDAHSNIKSNHSSNCAQVDKPIAGLLKDLKQRGLLDETLVVWATEFGRTPGAQGTGRNHHPFGFSVWMAGGGIKGGVVHGATDELGFHAAEDRHYVTDIHATVLHQMGLDSHKLEVPGRKRLEFEHGRPIREIIA